MSVLAAHGADIVIDEQVRARSLRVILLMEVWERFGFYCIQSIVVLFLISRMGFSDGHASLLWGAFTAMNYAMPAIGGWVGDQVLGSRRALMSGMLILFVGYGSLAVPTSSRLLVYFSLAVISVGTGLFKPNAASLVHHIQEGSTKGVDVAFTLYYMAISIGSTLALLATPLIQNLYGWYAAFLSGAIGIALGTGYFAFAGRSLHGFGSDPDFRGMDARRMALVIVAAAIAIGALTVMFGHPVVAENVVWLAGLIVVVVWALIYRRSTPEERVGLGLLYLLTFETMLFFVFNQQIGTSLTLFAARCVDPDFFIAGLRIFSLLPGQFQAFNTIWLIAATPIVTMLYRALEQRGIYVSISAKFVGGFMLLALSFLIWWVSTMSGEGRVSPWVMVAGYGAFSVGELLISALGLAAVARYAPRARSGLLMGTCFVTRGVGMYAGSILASLAPIDVSTAGSLSAMLGVYGGLFRMLFLIAFVGTILFWLLSPTARRWDARYREGR
jgi:proton-dependent oligopeptide transporter, POT family